LFEFGVSPFSYSGWTICGPRHIGLADLFGNLKIQWSEL